MKFEKLTPMPRTRYLRGSVDFRTDVLGLTAIGSATPANRLVDCDALMSMPPDIGCVA
jgi:hypothetical protein